MKLKREEKLKAIALRERGFSLNEIVEKVGVAKSSVSCWVRNVPLSKKARKRLLTKITAGQLTSAENKRRKTEELISGYKREALKEIKETNTNRGLDKIICALLYWCEGAKSASSGVRFTNSDPKLVKVFLKLFRQSFDINEDKIRIGLHLHRYHNSRKQIAFWANMATVPQNQFIRPYLKQNTGRRIRKDYPGCVTVYYHSNKTARQLLAIAEMFLQKVGA